MTRSGSNRSRIRFRQRLAARFVRNRAGSSAVEFAIVAMPFFLLLMGIAQVGVFYMAQSALDTGVINTAELLRTRFTTGTTAILPAASELKNSVASAGGGMIQQNTLSVELQQLNNLSSGIVAIAPGTADYGTTTSTLVLRAQATVPTFAPGLGSMNIIRSSAMVRRQGT